MDYILIQLLAYHVTGACFLIPAFGSRQTNATYIQDLDESGKILGFYEIEASNYVKALTFDTVTTYHVGSEGVFAVRLSDGEIITGKFVDLKSQLSDVDLQQRGSPFFNVDAFSFLGKIADRQQAIKQARRCISNEVFAQNWSDTELKMQSIGLRPVISTPILSDGQSDLDPGLLWLLNNLGDKKWTRRWMFLWLTGKYNATLSNVAVIALRDRESSSNKGPIISALLQKSGFSEPFITYSIEWLINNRRDLSTWTEVWRDAFAASLRIRRKTESLDTMGLEYLHESNSSIPPRSRQWIMVWQYQSRYSTYQIQVLESVRTAIYNYTNDSIFQKRVVASLLSSRFLSEEKIEIVLDWMLAASVSNVWIKCFSNMVRAREDMRIMIKAEEFVTSGLTQLSGWKTLWDFFRSDESNAKMTDLAAQRWLTSNTQNMNIWPSVLLECFKDRIIPPQILQIAHGWLASHSRNPQWTKVSSIVDVNQSSVSSL